MQAAGNEPQVAELSPERERELEALAALREGFADGPRFGAPSTAPVAPGIIGPPAPGGLDPLAPEVADAPQGQVLSPGVPATEAPRVADDEPQEALLATSPLPRAAEDVPLLLKLLAGGLVLGSAAVWATAKQELQASRGTPTTA
ncbi:hypothetical protein FTX61_02385 [Nitriliruptoraceae bacterium ZYF776]|nr:hypothetical protein [Profundirhabdus halotolerans]